MTKGNYAASVYGAADCKENRLKWHYRQATDSLISWRGLKMDLQDFADPIVHRKTASQGAIQDCTTDIQ